MSLKIFSFGMPRTILNNKLHTSVKDYLDKKISQNEFNDVCKNIRIEGLRLQKKLEVDVIPSNDFTVFDHVADTSCMVGNINRRYYWEGGKVPLDIYFSFAYGFQKDKFDVAPLELSKYFNTNYKYLVPEFSDPVEFIYSDNKQVVEYLEAKSIGIDTTPIIMGPLTYLLLGKTKEADIDVFEFFDEFLSVYENLCLNLTRARVKQVCFYEPFLCNDLTSVIKSKYKEAYKKIKSFLPDTELMLAVFYGNSDLNINLINELTVDRVHIDISSTSSTEIDFYLNNLDFSKKYSLGIVSGDNTWINDIDESVKKINKFIQKSGNNDLYISTSCPMFNLPFDVKLEKGISPDITKFVSLAVQKQEELSTIKKEILKPSSQVKIIEENKINIELLKKYSKIDLSMCDKDLDKKNRNQKKSDKNSDFKNKILPTTTVGYFPINDEIKDILEKEIAKKPLKKKDTDIIVSEIDSNINTQVKLGIDVISYSEVDRLSDSSLFANSTTGSVVLQYNYSLKSGDESENAVLIFSDLEKESNLIKQDILSMIAKKYSNQNIKITIPGPVSLVNDCYVNEYISRDEITTKILHFLGDEISYLSKNGIKTVCLNESNFLKSSTSERTNRNKNLIEDLSFLSKISKIFDEKTRFELYFGYFNMNELVEDFDKINADLIIFESSRSQNEILESFVSYKNSTNMAIGCYEPSNTRRVIKNEILKSMKRQLRFISEQQMFFAPDCGFLKQDPSFVEKDLTIAIKAANEVRDFINNKEI